MATRGEPEPLNLLGPEGIAREQSAPWLICSLPEVPHMSHEVTPTRAKRGRQVGAPEGNQGGSPGMPPVATHVPPEQLGCRLGGGEGAGMP